MARECLICMSEDSGETPLLRLPCGSHDICGSSEDGCLASYFRQAMNEERLYPARCCQAVLFIDDYEDILPFDLIWEYMRKEREYSVPARLRIHCADASCSQFVHPEDYQTTAGVTFAKCSACSAISCTTCKTLLCEDAELDKCHNTIATALDSGEITTTECQNETGKRCGMCRAKLLRALIEHRCKVGEAEAQFKKTSKEKGYQECHGCGSTVELAEACNHITCECGSEFCYVCGQAWGSIPRCEKGCPRYGLPEYDAQGYNQDGYHKETGLDREGLSPREEYQQRNAVEDNEDGDDDEDHIDGVEGVDFELFDSLDPDTQQLILSLDVDERAIALAEARFHAAERGEVVLGDVNDDGQDEENEQNADDQENDIQPAENINEDVLDDGLFPADAVPNDERPEYEVPLLPQPSQLAGMPEMPLVQLPEIPLIQLPEMPRIQMPEIPQIQMLEMPEHAVEWTAETEFFTNTPANNQGAWPIYGPHMPEEEDL